jgi:hypothetical protein
MPQNGATDRAVGERPIQSLNHEGHKGSRRKPSGIRIFVLLRALCDNGLATLPRFCKLDAAFRAHLFLTFFEWRNSESVSAAPATHTVLQRVQSRRPLSRLLVLDLARETVTISASSKAESRARIR